MDKSARVVSCTVPYISFISNLAGANIRWHLSLRAQHLKGKSGGARCSISLEQFLKARGVRAMYKMRVLECAHGSSTTDRPAALLSSLIAHTQPDGLIAKWFSRAPETASRFFWADWLMSANYSNYCARRLAAHINFLWTILYRRNKKIKCVTVSIFYSKCF